MGEENQYSRMVNMTDDKGDKLFTTLEISLMCSACKAEKKETCEHKAHELPPWKSQRRQDLVSKLMEDPAMAQRELLGVITGSAENCCFSIDGLDAFASSSWAFDSTSFMADNLFMCIDPNGGGTSGLAFASGFVSRGCLVVVAVDSFAVNSDEEQERAIAQHVATARKAMGSSGARATIVTCVEANYGGWVGASRICACVQQYPPAKHLSLDTSKMQRPGVWTSAESKEKMRLALQLLLRAQTIRFASTFASATVGAKELLIKQLRRYRYEIKQPASTSFGKPTRHLTGKLGSESDDLAIVLQMLALFPQHYLDREKR